MVQWRVGKNENKTLSGLFLFDNVYVCLFIVRRSIYVCSPMSTRECDTNKNKPL